MEINFKINNKCNLDCEYCLWKQHQHYDAGKSKQTLKLIKRLYKDVGDVYNSFYIHGGESSFHPKFEYIFDGFKIDNCPTEIQTNLTTKNVDFLIKTFDLISVSFHYKELIKVKKLDLYMQNLEKVAKSGKLYLFDIMLENLGSDQSKYLEFIKSKLLKYVGIAKSSEMIYAYWDNSNIMNNSDVFEMNRNFYNKHNKTLKSYIWPGWKKNLSTNENWDHQESSKGLYCLAGCKKFHIFGNGDVYKCASHETQGIGDFNRIKKDGISEPLGNIIEDYSGILQMTKDYKKCEFNYCGGDFYVPRAKTKLQLKLLERSYR